MLILSSGQELATQLSKIVRWVHGELHVVNNICYCLQVQPLLLTLICECVNHCLLFLAPHNEQSSKAQILYFFAAYFEKYQFFIKFSLRY